ncbi:Glycerophosphodiester phosphodiesterase GDPD6 [Linum perenne]
MFVLGFAPIILFLSVVVAVSDARPLYLLPSKVALGVKQPLQTSRPYNIAHRGSNGELPEETGPSYMVRAIEEGADFIETDILSTKDGVLVCFHDVTLDETTDILEHKEFADRKRTYEVQGENMTGFFIVDFTLKELKTLRTKQRLSFRNQQYNGRGVVFLNSLAIVACWGKYPIITFDEYISIALDAPRVVGIYPEMKNPVFINEHVKWSGGRRYEDVFMATVKKYGYKGSYLSKDWMKQPVFIQSFAPTSLLYVSNLTDIPLLFLIDDVTVLTEDTKQKDYYFNDLQTYSEITSDAYLDYIKNYVVGIGPWKDTVVPVVDNHMQAPTDLVARAHARNLQVHPYTYRNENKYLHFDFNQDPYQEYEYWINKMGVDGLFTDFTGTLHRYQELTSPLSNDDNNTSVLHKIALLVTSFRNG